MYAIVVKGSGQSLENTLHDLGEAIEKNEPNTGHLLYSIAQLLLRTTKLESYAAKFARHVVLHCLTILKCEHAYVIVKQS